MIKSMEPFAMKYCCNNAKAVTSQRISLRQLYQVNRPISDTTRPVRHGEINGKEYFFISRDKMEEEVEAGKFIEYGEYKGNLYGTSADSVKSLVDAGYVCILNPHYQVRSLYPRFLDNKVDQIRSFFYELFMGLDVNAVPKVD